VIPPNDKVVLGVKFAMAMTACLSALEVAHMAFLGTWSSEIFLAISGLIERSQGVDEPTCLRKNITGPGGRG
jgi:hypothetical protein